MSTRFVPPRSDDRFCVDPMDGDPLPRAGILGLLDDLNEMQMSQFSGFPQAALDYNSTIIGAPELSERKWILAVQLPGARRHSRHVLDACGDGLVAFVERLKPGAQRQVGRSLGSY